MSHGSVFDIIRISREDPRAWAWMPLVFQRMGRFATEYDTGSLPEEVVELVRYWFMTGDQRLGLWIVTKDEVQLVGHMWATMEPIDVQVSRYLLVRQAEVNRGVDIRWETKQAFDQLKEWGEKAGLTRIVMATHRRGALMARRWGFKEHKVVMRLELHDPPGA